MQADNASRARKKSSERGIAMFMCIFALLLVTGVVLAMLASSDNETVINQNYRETQVAYFAAKAGLNEAVSRLNAATITAPTIMPAAGAAGVVYIINKKSASEVVTPWDMGSTYADTELCKENFLASVANTGIGVPCAAVPSGTYYTSYTSTSPFTSTAGALDYKWVRVTLKGNSSNYPYYTNTSAASATLATQVCSSYSAQALLPSGAASCQAAAMQPVYVVTSLAVTPRGTRRMAQMEITKVVLPPLPGALTFNGPGSTLTPPYDAPNSNGFYINGNDHGGCGGTNHAAVGSTDTATNNQIIGAIPNGRLDHYTGVGSTTPDVEVISQTQLGDWTSPAAIEALAARFKLLASSSNVYTPETRSGATSWTDINIGSQATPQITFVDGDLSMTGSTRGGGVLIVTGRLSLSGNSGFYGVILAIGKGYIEVNGGGSGEFDGGVLVAHTRDNSGNVLTSLGNPIVDWSGGGGNGIYYNQCAINAAQNNLGFKVMANRELMY